MALKRIKPEDLPKLLTPQESRKFLQWLNWIIPDDTKPEDLPDIIHRFKRNLTKGEFTL